MNESDLPPVLLVRAIETAAPGADAPPWRPDDADWASAEARRQVGESADAEQFTVARARLVLARLGLPAHGGRGAASGLRPRLALLPGLALVVGLAGESLTAGGRVQLLSWPLIGLVAWNLAVLLLSLPQLWRRLPPARTDAATAWRHPWQGLVQRLLARGSDALDAWAMGATAPGNAWQQAAGRQAEGALRQATQGLTRLRAQAWLHAAAAALALGVVSSMYLRGLVLDFRAGWDSTFLQAGQVHALLQVLLAPAQALFGLGLPSPEALAGLRWADGGPGAAAAPWIHRLAAALLGWVVLPRLALAAVLSGRAARLARRLPWPADEGGYFARLRRRAPARPRPVSVVTYSYTVPEASRAGLAEALIDHLGPGAQPQWLPVTAMGAEDAPLPPLQADVVALLSMTATPERETHGRFLQHLAQQRPQPSGLRLWLDSSAFERRLAGQPDADTRRRQRLQAWQQLAQALGLPQPQAMDLAARSLPAHPGHPDPQNTAAAPGLSGPSATPAGPAAEQGRAGPQG